MDSNCGIIVTSQLNSKRYDTIVNTQVAGNSLTLNNANIDNSTIIWLGIRNYDGYRGGVGFVNLAVTKNNQDSAVISIFNTATGSRLTETLSFAYFLINQATSPSLLGKSMSSIPSTTQSTSISTDVISPSALSIFGEITTVNISSGQLNSRGSFQFTVTNSACTFASFILINVVHSTGSPRVYVSTGAKSDGSFEIGGFNASSTNYTGTLKLQYIIIRSDQIDDMPLFNSLNPWNSTYFSVNSSGDSVTITDSSLKCGFITASNLFSITPGQSYFFDVIHPGVINTSTIFAIAGDYTGNGIPYVQVNQKIQGKFNIAITNIGTANLSDGIDVCFFLF